MLLTRQLSGVWRHATRYLRHLPTTVVLGGQADEAKRLAGCLASHPRCFSAARLETRYFSDHSARSVGWYRAAFPLSVRVRRTQGQVVEASTSYLALPNALRQMRQVLTKIRIVVLLGDPVARAHDHFQQRQNSGAERRGFEECVAEEIRSAGYAARFGEALEPNVAPMLGYVSQGYYALQLELLQKLYPRNKILVMDRASLLTNANAACDRIFNFMGLESVEIEPPAVEAVGHGRDVIHPRAERLLREHYRPFDELLREISEQRFSWMQPALADAA
jgi:hypothetical protein